jgi:membrane associated rhomboid family serine protease
MIPLTVDVPMKRLPWANWALIVATVAVSLAVPTEGGTPSHLSPLVLQREGFTAYQLVTALFQHADLLHLFGNMLFLFVFGNAINAKLGHLRFLAAYLGIGAMVNAGWLALGHEDTCLGASAAIMGLCGMFFVLYPRNGVSVYWDEVEFALLARSWSGEVPGWAAVLFYLIFDLWHTLTDGDSGVGYVAHIAGTLLGAGLAIALLKGRWLAPDRGEQTLLQWLAGEGPAAHDPPHLRRRTQGAQTPRKSRKKLGVEAALGKHERPAR